MPATTGIALVLGLAGCTTKTTTVTSSTVTVLPEAAFVQMPAGGPRMINVIERRLNGSVEQDIFLETSAATPGQNMINIRLFGASSRLTASETARSQFKPLREEDITAEIRRAVPGHRLQRSPYFVQNAYGPFSYATGRGVADDLCLYAWQQIRAPGAERSPFQNFGVIQIRLRLCAARATPDSLLSVIYGLTVTGSAEASGWNPYGGPAAVDPRLGRGGTPVYPPSEAVGGQAANATPERVRRVRPADKAVEADRGPVSQVRTGRSVATVTVPSPSGSENGSVGAGNGDFSRLSAVGASAGTVIVPPPICANGAVVGTDCP